MKAKDQSRFSIETLRDLVAKRCLRVARLISYAEHVNQFAGTGDNHADAAAAKLIARMAAVQSTAEQAAYVATLKARHRQIRNFMKLPG
jgi:hypothetical protein